MKKPTAAALTALALLVLTAIATGAIAAPTAAPMQATPLQTGDCGLRMYSCQPCTIAATPEKLCYTQICGNLVIEHCDACAVRCILPPS
jgi:hypothetical protein